MPTIDMTLEQLKKYEGRNPCPTDIDGYWERALKEMKDTDPCIELISSSFKTPFAECFDLYFTGVRNARIHAKYVRPKENNSMHPAILQFHGYSGNCGDWTDKLSYAAMGYSVAALDCRGQGGLSEDTGGTRGNTFKGHIIRGLDDSPDNLLMRHIFLDTAQLAGIIMDMDEVNKTRIGAMGGSQGGGLALACASLVPDIKRLAPIHPFLSDYQRVWEMDLAKGPYEEITTYFRRFDPEHKREQEVFTTLGYIDIQHLVKRIKGEVLMGTGLMDNVCPPSTQFAAYNKIKAPKNMVIFHDYAHEGMPGFADKTYQFMMGL